MSDRNMATDRQLCDCCESRPNCMHDEIELLRADLAIQAVNARAVLQAWHERDCAVEKLAESRQLLEDWMLSSDNFDLEAWVLKVRDFLEGSNPFNSQDDVGGGA